MKRVQSTVIKPTVDGNTDLYVINMFTTVTVSSHLQFSLNGKAILKQVKNTSIRSFRESRGAQTYQPDVNISEALFQM
jgi:hypothetical protein